MSLITHDGQRFYLPVFSLFVKLDWQRTTHDADNYCTNRTVDESRDVAKLRQVHDVRGFLRVPERDRQEKADSFVIV
jgi:hypothetical protein